MATCLVKPVGNRLQRNYAEGQIKQNRMNQPKIQDAESVVSEFGRLYLSTIDKMMKLSGALNGLTTCQNNPRQHHWKKTARSIQATLVREAGHIQLANETLDIVRQCVSIYARSRPELKPDNASPSESRSSRFGELMISSIIEKARMFRLKLPFVLTDVDREILGLDLSDEEFRKRKLKANGLIKSEASARFTHSSDNQPFHSADVICDGLDLARTVQDLLEQLQDLSVEVDQLTSNRRERENQKRRHALRLLRIRLLFERERIKTLDKAMHGFMECQRIRQQLITDLDLRPIVGPDEEQDPRAAAIYSRLCREMMDRAAALPGGHNASQPN
jgi:hypothetical protein